MATRAFSQAYNIWKEITGEKNTINDNHIKSLTKILDKLTNTFFRDDGMANSDLSGILEHDLVKILGLIFKIPEAANHFQKYYRGPLKLNNSIWEFYSKETPYKHEYNNDRNVTLADCFENKEEHKQALNSLVTFEALRISAELEFSWGENALKRAVIKTPLFPNLSFARSRFFNLFQPRDKHDQIMLNTTGT